MSIFRVQNGRPMEAATGHSGSTWPADVCLLVDASFSVYLLAGFQALDIWNRMRSIANGEIRFLTAWPKSDIA